MGVGAVQTPLNLLRFDVVVIVAFASACSVAAHPVLSRSFLETATGPVRWCDAWACDAQQDGAVHCRRLDRVLLARQHMSAAATAAIVTSSALASLSDHLPVVAIVSADLPGPGRP